MVYYYTRNGNVIIVQGNMTHFKLKLVTIFFIMRAKQIEDIEQRGSPEEPCRTSNERKQKQSHFLSN